MAKTIKELSLEMFPVSIVTGHNCEFDANEERRRIFEQGANIMLNRLEPEKIWIDPTNDLPKLSGHIDKDNVEYIRKDAFIEKALAYLNNKFYFNNLHYFVENNTFNSMEEMFEDFEEYMRGE